MMNWFKSCDKAEFVSVLPPPLTPPTRGGGKTFPPPQWGRSGGDAELLPKFLGQKQNIINQDNYPILQITNSPDFPALLFSLLNLYVS